MMAEFSFFGALFLSQSELSVCNQETDYVILHGTMSKGTLHKSRVCIHEALRTPEVIVQIGKVNRPRGCYTHCGGRKCHSATR